MTAGVVRVGDTVRRPPGANDEFVGTLLRHLEGAGFDAAPRFLGLDEHGRLMLSFIEGEVPSDCRSSIWTDEQLAQSARLLRRFHDATHGAALAGGAEVVCHNDFGPWNLVWRDAAPIAVIDFDSAAPGRGLDDLGYAAWKFLNLGLIESPVREQRRRLAVLAASYGIRAVGELLVAIATAQRRMKLLIEAAPSGPRRDDALSQHEREAAWLAAHGSELVD